MVNLNGRVFWDPSLSDSVIALGNNGFAVYDINGGSNLSQSAYIMDSFCSSIRCGRWNLHDPKQFAVGTSTDLAEWDLRSNQPAFIIKNAHDISVR